jgi:nitrous oxide reductase accessory protein NosL
MKTKAIFAALSLIILSAGCKKEVEKTASPGPINYSDYADGGGIGQSDIYPNGFLPAFSDVYR